MDPQGIIEELNFRSQVALNGIWGCISPETGQEGEKVLHRTENKKCLFSKSEMQLIREISGLPNE